MFPVGGKSSKSPTTSNSQKLTLREVYTMRSGRVKSNSFLTKERKIYTSAIQMQEKGEQLFHAVLLLEMEEKAGRVLSLGQF